MSPDVMYGQNVGMAESSHGPCFPFEALQVHLGVGWNVRRSAAGEATSTRS